MVGAAPALRGQGAGYAGDWDQPAVTSPSGLQELPLTNLQPTLCILSSKVYAGIEVLVDRALRIGRDADNDLRLPGDSAMSRHHAVIFPTDECLFVEDVGSTNGTFVNGLRVGKAPLNHNDRVRIGDTVFQVRYAQVAPSVSAASAVSGGAASNSNHDKSDNHGEALRRWRKDSGLTQTALAAKLGVSQRSVSLWEQGAAISPENLKKLRDKAGFGKP